MNKDRLWIIGAGAALVIIALLGWTLGISPLVDQASAANAQVATITSTNQASQLQLQKLKSEYANIDQFKKDLAALRVSIPSDASLASFLKEINTLCDQNHVELQSVAIADATLYVNPNSTVSAVPVAGSTATPTPTPTAAAGATTTTTAPVATAGSKAGDFVLLPVTISYSGSFSDVMSFTGGVQTGPRLFASKSFSVLRNSSQGNGLTYAATIAGTVYALKGLTPDTVEITTTPIDSTPTPEPTPTDTATPDPTNTPAPPTGAPTTPPSAPATTKP